jgi:multisite-specific tRNA:(cytosine-C5)-methyltransferase
MLLRIFNDTTPLINNQKQPKAEEDKEETVAPGFKVEDGEVKVKTSTAIEAAAPVNENPLNVHVKPGPYSSIVASDDAVMNDVNADKIAKGEDTGGLEQQLNGTVGVEEQLGSVS